MKWTFVCYFELAEGDTKFRCRYLVMKLIIIDVVFIQTDLTISEQKLTQAFVYFP